MRYIEPKNRKYLSSEDFPSWNDSFGALVKDTLNLPDKEKMKFVRNITFIVTEDCNLRCSYCYQPNKTHKHMTKEVGKRVVDFLLEGDKFNGYIDTENCCGVILDFIGGEPLLEIDLIDHIVDYFRFKAFALGHPWATNYMVSISSNGVMYNNPRVQKFLQKNNGRVSFGISIDGNKELHDSCRLFPNGEGSYDLAFDAVKKHIANYGMDRTKATISPENLPYLTKAIKHLWSIGLSGVMANTVYEEGWTIEDARLFYKELRQLADYLLEDQNYTRYFTSLFSETIGQPAYTYDNWCGGNGAMLAIGPDGRCFPCLRYADISMSTPGRKGKSIGDIYEGIHSKEEDEWLCKLCSITAETQSNEECLGCQIASGCGSCNGYQYDKFGDPNHRATFICVMHKARVLVNVYYWNKLYAAVNEPKKFELHIPEEWALQIIDQEEYDYLLELSRKEGY